MFKTKEKISLILIDFITINFAWCLQYYIRVESGIFAIYTSVEFLVPMFVIFLFWLLIFSTFGMYDSWSTKSRVDEFVTSLKAVTFGVLVLFFVVFIDDTSTGVRESNRLLIILYWSLLVFSVGIGRALLHSLEKNLLKKGIGLSNTLIIGWSDKAKNLYNSLKNNQSLGYKIIGFVSTNGHYEETEFEGKKIYDSLHNLPALIEELNIKEVLIAIDSKEHDKLLEIISICEPFRTGLKIMPDLYDIVTGQARTNQIFGAPLIDIMPQLMTNWERVVKRLIDITFSFIVLIVSLPLFILIALAIKMESRGSILYRQQRVGKDARLFTILKFRSMYSDAEKHSGPQWAKKNDPRITHIGYFLRKFHLDELPQFINVLKGDMSLIGPRPERPFFVQKLSKELPLYTRRLKVRPGITGWAQVKLKYDESLEDVKVKVQYDLFYIENISLKMDLKIAISTIISILTGKGH
jgi:exopolysaccharide biosynthesis polyprenyl glycosylphosphotransferase